jgi:hypothetical protein
MMVSSLDITGASARPSVERTPHRTGYSIAGRAREARSDRAPSGDPAGLFIA